MLTFFIRSALHSSYKELLSVKLMLTCGLQDDFAPPAEKLPIHPVHNVQDWDDPEGEPCLTPQRSHRMLCLTASNARRCGGVEPHAGSDAAHQVHGGTPA